VIELWKGQDIEIDLSAVSGTAGVISRFTPDLRLWESMVMRDLCEISNRINELETKIFLKKKGG